MFDKTVLLKELTPADYTWLLANSKKRVVLENEIIITQGEKPSEIYIVSSGLFSLVSETGEQFGTVGPGGIIGGIIFFTESAASVSVIAVESNSVVLAISLDTLKAHLINDSGFSLRFYRLMTTIFSERLQSLIASFIKPSIPKSIDTSPILVGPVPLFNGSEPNFNLIHQLLESLPPMSNIFKDMEQNKNTDQVLKQREDKLSVATMATKSIKLLWELAKDEGVNDLDRRTIRHKASITAAEKQSFLPSCYIQKTITILIENKFVLCSSIGDLKIHHQLLRQIVTMLNLSHHSLDSYINPAAFIPEVELGLLRGSVSTFFAPQRITRLSLVILNNPSGIDLKKDIAISLSPFESLLLPMTVFPGLVKKYAERAYPYIPFKSLSFDN